MPVGAGVASIGSSVAGGLIGSNAAGDAAKAAQGAATANNALAGQVYNTNSGNLQPYVQTGQSATNALSGLLGIGGDPAASDAAFKSYLGSTNYNFVQNQGEQGIEYANAPSFNSSGTAKALDTYNTSLAGNALAGYEGQLSGLGSQGVSAASTLGSLGTQYVSQVASDNNNAAGVQGSADLASANSWTNALKSLTQSGSSAGTASSFGAPTALSTVANGVGSAASSGFNALSGLFGG